MQNKIVIIDDDTTLLKTLVDFFTEKHYEVYGADSGHQGLEYIYDKKPVIILLDIMMPEMNGLDVIKDISNTDKSLLKNIIIMTNAAEMDYLSEALELGVSNYLIKSDMSLETLLDKVHAFAV